MAIFDRLFRWRSRVKTGGPEITGGGVETLSSHTTDENAHPIYLKKGQAVPTGQEYYVMGLHTSDPKSHSKNVLLRAEALKTEAQYHAAKAADYVDNASNYDADIPVRHIVTAYVLNLLLNKYVAKDDMPKDVGDGTNLIYVDPTGVFRVSNSNIGGSECPVYLKNGKITALTHNVVFTETAQTINGKKTFSSMPDVTSGVYPVTDNDLVNLGWLKSHIVPVGFCTTSTTVIDGAEVTASVVAAKYGYGTWQRIAELGNYGYLWLRTA